MLNTTQKNRSLLLIVLLILLGKISCCLAGLKSFDTNDVNISKYPWVVSVRVDYTHACVGTIITDQHILTSANCVSATESTPIDIKRVTIRMGSNNLFAGGQIVNIGNITIHPGYGNFLHNVAILQVSEVLKFNEKVNKINLVEEDFIVAEGSEVLVAGWGLDTNQSFSHQLKEMNMNVLTAEECEAQAGFGYKSVICLEHAKHEGICPGAQGSGIVLDGKLIGVASFAFGACGTKFPDISCKISYYHNWINSVILSYG